MTDVMLDAALDRLLAAARHAWPDKTAYWNMPAVLAKCAGDFAGACRDDVYDQPAADKIHATAPRELGNLLLTSVRYLDDLGIPPVDAIAAATDAQHAYRQRTATPDSGQ